MERIRERHQPIRTPRSRTSCAQFRSAILCNFRAVMTDCGHIEWVATAFSN